MAKPKSHINRAREDMQKLGVYKPEFEPLIGVYSQLMEQYDVITKRFIDSDYQFSEYTETGSKKAPIVTTLETLRKDILAYGSALGLTPQGLLRADDKVFKKKSQSALSEILKELKTG